MNDFVVNFYYGAIATEIVASIWGVCRALIVQANPYPAVGVLVVAVALVVLIDQREYRQRCRMEAGRRAVWDRRDREAHGDA